jgi:hypothetical protein
MNTENLISELREKQNKEFLDKILRHNKKEASVIITKYDLKHSLLDVINMNDDFKVTVEKIKHCFEERAKFLNFMSEYL